jgi:hypothetical protein
MSNHHARPAKKRSGIVLQLLLPPLLVLVIAIPFIEWLMSRSLQAWPSVNGRLLETRIAVVGTQLHQYEPSEIQYRVEAHVAYNVKETHYDVWAPASDIKTDRDYLAFWLSLKKSQEAVIYWNPKDPSDVDVVLQ